jgi:hypothetical protein
MTDYSELLDGYDNLQVALLGGAKLVIDLEKGASFGTIEYGATVDDRTTFRAHYGVERSYSFPESSSAHRLRADFADGGRIADLIERILEGGIAEVAVAGHCIGNLVGILDDDAREADDDLHDIANDYDTDLQIAAWKIGDWLTDYTAENVLEDIAHITVGATDAQISAAAADVVQQALRDDVVIVGGANAVEEYLRDAIDTVVTERGEDEEDEDEAVAA